MMSIFALVAATSGAPLTAAEAPRVTADAPTPRVIEWGMRDKNMEIISESEIIIDGHTYTSWEAVIQSGYYGHQDTRCGIPSREVMQIGAQEIAGSSGADCNFARTRIEPQYEPSVAKYRIPVVVHVIQRTNGTGNISDARVRSQIDILNEDFQAIAGTNGRFGNDAQIEFYLATEDPSGNPTNGITRSTNNTWFNDGGSYWNTLAWDTNRYLNIYTNSASGALGYVPNLPASGIAGSNSDRVVVLYSSFGRNAPLAPYNLGRTATHEVGHYLGLDHTFAGGCSNSFTSGDLIVDTNPESSPTGGCPGSRTSCGLPAPFDNYMDYSDDRCMEQFTPQQNNRMRCSLINWRPNLYELAVAPEPCSEIDLMEPFGSYDFGDVSAFLFLFADQDSGADLDNSGSIDFGDVSAFLSLFAAGCP